MAVVLHRALAPRRVRRQLQVRTRYATSACPFVYTYTAFGQQYGETSAETVPQRYTFTGRESAGPAARAGGAPMYYRYRMYSPAHGRFGRRWIDYHRTPNPYDYQLNRPTMLRDPMGDPDTPGDVGVGYDPEVQIGPYEGGLRGLQVAAAKRGWTSGWMCWKPTELKNWQKIETEGIEDYWNYVCPGDKFEIVKGDTSNAILIGRATNAKVREAWWKKCEAKRSIWLPASNPVGRHSAQALSKALASATEEGGQPASTLILASHGGDLDAAFSFILRPAETKKLGLEPKWSRAKAGKYPPQCWVRGTVYIGACSHAASSPGCFEYIDRLWYPPWITIISTRYNFNIQQSSNPLTGWAYYNAFQGWQGNVQVNAEYWNVQDFLAAPEWTSLLTGTMLELPTEWMTPGAAPTSKSK